MRFNNGVPNQLTQTIVYPDNVKYIRNLLPDEFLRAGSVDAQPADAAGRHPVSTPGLQLSRSQVGGPGYSFAPDEIFYPAGSTAGYDWKDVTPRVGVAYDLFGNGKTAVKFNLGKYMEAITATNSDLDMNPLIRTTIQHDARVDGHEQGLRAGLRSQQLREERRMRGHGQPDPGTAGLQPVSSTRASSPAWAPAPYNWGWGSRSSRKWCPASR